MKRLYAIQKKDGTFWCMGNSPEILTVKKDAKDFEKYYSSAINKLKVVQVEIKVIK